jgi:flagellum-specific ATP synthase
MGDGLLGRVVDAQGLAAGPWRPVQDVVAEPMDRRQINAMDRDPVREPGYRRARHQRAADRGAGQRLGLFAGSGVGKACCWA